LYFSNSSAKSRNYLWIHQSIKISSQKYGINLYKLQFCKNIQRGEKYEICPLKWSALFGQYFAKYREMYLHFETNFQAVVNLVLLGKFFAVPTRC
jgi:hypothetical protein